MDLTKWPEKIWPVCEELKPEGLNMRDTDDGLYIWTVDLDGIECEDEDPSEDWKGEPSQTLDALEVMIPPQTAAALIRDKAVWWLARPDEDQGVAIVRYADLSGVCLMPEPDDRDARRKARCVSADPTEALYLAVCKVLGVTP